MRLSARAVHGLKALAVLARAGGEGLTLAALAGHTGSPAAYLAKLVAPLKSAGLVSAARGYRGGVSLALPASRIALARVLEVLEGPLVELDPAGGVLDPAIEVLRSGLEGAMRSWVAGVTLEDLASRGGAWDWSI
ncbi:MAG TPA: Rrf2 family transcriptional regulator [Spirochaetales bacterium]|nr:Rrf2 family transcriptional regulator [Spirochaetales bacterium]